MWSASTLSTVLFFVSGTILLTDAFLPAKPIFVTKPDAQQQTNYYEINDLTLLTHFHDQRRCMASTLLFMGWGPEPVWSTAAVKSNVAANESGESVSMTVSVPPETAQEYNIPGQYVQIRFNEETKPLFLAIASPPSAENASFEFLIKKRDDNDWMTSAAPGTNLQISQVLGGGFPIAENIDGFKYDFPTQNVLLFAAGSGIAPLRAAIESGQLGVAASGSGGRTARLYYGVRTEEDLCFVDKFAEWEASGVQIVPVLSQPGDGWAGRTGYVQTCLEEDGVPIPRNSGALLCGMKGMAESVTDVLTKAGVFEGRVLTNF
jgi:NAD(P)H-flavin reductase